MARKDSVGVEGRGRKGREDDENISYVCMELSVIKHCYFSRQEDLRLFLVSPRAFPMQPLTWLLLNSLFYVIFPLEI